LTPVLDDHAPLDPSFVIVDTYRFNESTSDNKLFGVYATGPSPPCR